MNRLEVLKKFTERENLIRNEILNSVEEKIPVDILLCFDFELCLRSYLKIELNRQMDSNNILRAQNHISATENL